MGRRSPTPFGHEIIVVMGGERCCENERMSRLAQCTAIDRKKILYPMIRFTSYSSIFVELVIAMLPHNPIDRLSLTQSLFGFYLMWRRWTRSKRGGGPVHVATPSIMVSPSPSYCHGDMDGWNVSERS